MEVQLENGKLTRTVMVHKKIRVGGSPEDAIYTLEDYNYEGRVNGYVFIGEAELHVDLPETDELEAEVRMADATIENLEAELEQAIQELKAKIYVMQNHKESLKRIAMETPTTVEGEYSHG